jgi:rubrerythrin
MPSDDAPGVRRPRLGEYPPYLRDPEARRAAEQAAQRARTRPMPIVLKSATIGLVVGLVIALFYGKTNAWVYRIVVLCASVGSLFVLERVIERRRVIRAYRSALAQFPGICKHCGHSLGPPPRPAVCPECGERLKPANEHNLEGG